FITLHAPGNSNGFYLGASNTGDSAPDSNGSTTFLFAGTSFSAPMVAGAISLLKAVRPSLTPAEIEALLRDNALPYPGNANFSQGAFGFTRSNCTSTACGVGLLNVLGALQATRALGNALPVANVQQSAVVASNGPFVLEGGLSTNTAGGSENLSFSWQQVFGNPVVLAGASTSTLQVQSGMAGNIAEFALTVTDTATNRSNTGVVRLANASVNERTFVPSATSGASGGTGVTTGSGASSSPAAVTATSNGGGGGGGALGLFGLIGLAALLQAHRRVSLSVYCKL
ncbi:MAG: S8 family serine peptidase, partial [Limnobacter sp.]